MRRRKGALLHLLAPEIGEVKELTLVNHLDLTNSAVEVGTELS